MKGAKQGWNNGSDARTEAKNGTEILSIRGVSRRKLFSVEKHRSCESPGVLSQFMKDLAV